MKYEVFICYKNDTAENYAHHLWKGLTEREITAFLASEDIPKKFKGTDKWWDYRDQAIRDCETFLMIVTLGFEISPEIQKEIALALKEEKDFMCLRHNYFPADMQTKLLKKYINLQNLQQITFGTSQELLHEVLHNLYKSKTAIEETPLPIRQLPADERRLFPMVHFKITQAIQNNPRIQRKLPNVGFNIRSSNDSPIKAKVEARVFLGDKDLGLVKGSQRGGKYMGYYDGKTLWNLNPYTIAFGNFSVPKICAETDQNLRIEVSVTLIDIDGQEYKLLPVSWTFMRDKNDWFFEPTGDC